MWHDSDHIRSADRRSRCDATDMRREYRDESGGWPAAGAMMDGGEEAAYFSKPLTEWMRRRWVPSQRLPRQRRGSTA